MADKLQGGVKAGAAQSISILVLLRSTTDNTEVTGKLYSDVTGSYCRQGGTRQAISMKTLAAVDSAFDAGGFKEIDATNQKGLYRFDIPDAAFATGADWVVASVQVTGCYAVHREFPLTTNVVQTGDVLATWTPTKAGYVDASIDGVHTDAHAAAAALPAVAPGAKGGLPILDAATGRVLTGFEAGAVQANANLISILGSAISGTAAWIAGAFNNFFNIQTPALTTASVNQTSQLVQRAEPPAMILASDIAAEIAALETADGDTATWLEALHRLRQRLVGTKCVFDLTAKTIKIYDTNGSTLLDTLTMTSEGAVDTLVRS